jgi:hypothetical protein
LSFASFCNVSAQLIENINCDAFTEEPFFNLQFIKQNKVKAINGEIKTKGNLEVIKDAKLVTRYEFDQTGKLIIQLGSFNTMGTKDTTFINYVYDDSLNLLTKRTNDAYGFFSYNYTFDEKNRVLSKTYAREENKGVDRYHFKLGKQYVIVKESYSYLEDDSTLTKSIYNNHDRVYQKTTFSFNEHKLLESEVSQYVINKKKTKTLFSYTEQGYMKGKTHWKNSKFPNEFEKWEYQYDELGNLTYIDYYKGEIHTTHQEVLYDKSTFMLKALLVQDVPSNFITIIKFTTEYYE